MRDKFTPIHQRFIKFYKLCNTDKKIFSVRHAAELAEDTYGNLKKWSKSKEGHESDFLMKEAAYKCATNTGRAFGNGEITEQEAFKYLKENNIRVEDLKYFQERAKDVDKKEEEFNNTAGKYGLKIENLWES